MSKSPLREPIQYTEITPEFLQQDIYELTAENPEDVINAQAYALENPGTTVLVNYQFGPAVSVDATGSLDSEIDDSYHRLLGGGLEPIDEGTNAILASGNHLCFQDFKEDFYQELEQHWTETQPELDLPLREDGKYTKDIYLESENDVQPKVARTAARMTPVRVYGAIWRDSPPGRELQDLMDEVSSGKSEEWPKYAQPVEEDTGEGFWDSITHNSDTLEPEDLDHVNPQSFVYNSDQKRNESSPWCATDIGRETTNKRTPGWNIGSLESR